MHKKKANKDTDPARLAAFPVKSEKNTVAVNTEGTKLPKKETAKRALNEEHDSHEEALDSTRVLDTQGLKTERVKIIPMRKIKTYEALIDSVEDN